MRGMRRKTGIVAYKIAAPRLNFKGVGVGRTVESLNRQLLYFIRGSSWADMAACGVSQELYEVVQTLSSEQIEWVCAEYAGLIHCARFDATVVRALAATGDQTRLRPYVLGIVADGHRASTENLSTMVDNGRRRIA